MRQRSSTPFSIRISSEQGDADKHSLKVLYFVYVVILVRAIMHVRKRPLTSYFSYLQVHPIRTGAVCSLSEPPRLSLLLVTAANHRQPAFVLAPVSKVFSTSDRKPVHIK